MNSIYRFKVKDIAISTRKKSPLFGRLHADPEGSGDYRIADQRLSKLPVGTTGCAPRMRPLAFAEPATFGGSACAGGCGLACADCCGLGCGGCAGCARASCLDSGLGSAFGAGLAGAVAVRTGAGFAAAAGCAAAACGFSSSARPPPNSRVKKFPDDCEPNRAELMTVESAAGGGSRCVSV